MCSSQLKPTVAIIGAGPAGCATAISYINKFTDSQTHQPEGIASICLFDASQNDEAVIGESIPPASSHALNALGLNQLVDGERHRTCPGSKSLWNAETPGYNDFYFNPVGQGYHLDRKYFNAQMARATENPCISTYKGYTLHSVIKQDDLYELIFRDKTGEQHCFEANYVVDASGISAGFCRRIGVARNILDQVVTASIILEDVSAEQISPYTLVEAVENGWWYAALLPDNKLIISFCSEAEVIKAEGFDHIDNWQQRLSKTKLISQEIPASLIRGDETVLKRLAQSAILSRVSGDNWLAVGDAASSYDSISSAGITKALQHGFHAGNALYDEIHNETGKGFASYQDVVFGDFNRYAKLRYDIYYSEKRFKHARFWQNRFTADRHKS